MGTEWHYVVEGTSHGPVSQEEFEQLVNVGTIRRDTLVWQEGMEDWLPYSRAGGSNSPPPMQAFAPAYDGQDPARADANTFLGALKDGFARYVDFKSRSTRPQYWWWVLWSTLISWGTTFVDLALGAGLGLLAFLVMFLPSIAVAVRRLHDIGRSGWWYLLIFVPIIGWIALIIFFCQKTDPQSNQWGQPPR